MANQNITIEKIENDLKIYEKIDNLMCNVCIWSIERDRILGNIFNKTKKLKELKNNIENLIK